MLATRTYVYIYTYIDPHIHTYTVSMLATHIYVCTDVYICIYMSTLNIHTHIHMYYLISFLHFFLIYLHYLEARLCHLSLLQLRSVTPGGSGGMSVPREHRVE